jgi:hypothetical protein
MNCRSLETDPIREIENNDFKIELAAREFDRDIASTLNTYNGLILQHRNTILNRSKLVYINTKNWFETGCVEPTRERREDPRHKVAWAFATLDRKTQNYINVERKRRGNDPYLALVNSIKDIPVGVVVVPTRDTKSELPKINVPYLVSGEGMLLDFRENAYVLTRRPVFGEYGLRVPTIEEMIALFTKHLGFS